MLSNVMRKHQAKTLSYLTLIAPAYSPIRTYAWVRTTMKSGLIWLHFNKNATPLQNLYQTLVFVKNCSYLWPRSRKVSGVSRHRDRKLNLRWCETVTSTFGGLFMYGNENKQYTDTRLFPRLDGTLVVKTSQGDDIRCEGLLKRRYDARSEEHTSELQSL